MRRILVLTATALCIPLFARADEQLTPLAAAGNWVAFEHRQSMEDPPDFCVAMDMRDGFALRSDGNDIEVRYFNHSWSLPSNVSGNLKLAVNGNSYVMPISDNTNIMVMAAITQDQLEKIVSDMNKASSMQLTPGSGSAVTISLNGSNQAVTAFLTCSGFNQPGSTGGENPFSSPSGNNPPSNSPSQ